MTDIELVPYNKTYLATNEIQYAKQLLTGGSIGQPPKFREQALRLLSDILRTEFLELTSSCTSALEAACLACDIGPGDEVIMPSYTFTSTANAVVLRGGIPVFVDICGETLNIDSSKIIASITDRTKAMIVVHYAGVSCDMDSLIAIARNNNLYLIEDAAQAIGSTYKGTPLGTIGDFGAISFHLTKNIQCGEGGALITKTADTLALARKIIDKGTNRYDMLNGIVDRYRWITPGSSYVMSDLQASVLTAQLEDASNIISHRVRVWNHYHEGLAGLESDDLLKRPVIELGAEINGHIYYVLLSRIFDRDVIEEKLRGKGIIVTSHYEPLHLSPAGKRYCRFGSDLEVTEDVSGRLLRLPIWPDMSATLVNRVIDQLTIALRQP